MLPRADLNPTRPPASLEAATSVVSSTDSRLEVFRRLNQIAIGRELQVTVDAMLDDGSFLVKVADTTARMALPVGTKVGDTLSMVFVAKDPRPTFLLTQQQGSAPASLSVTARLIDQLRQSAEQDGGPNAVNSRLPLILSPSGLDPKQVALALQKALSASGLFYESHLHDWISGTRTTAELTREPQSQLGESLKHTGQADTQQDSANAELARIAANMREIGDGAQKLVRLIQDARLHAGNPAATDADLIAQIQPALPTVEPEAARMINLQLSTLEHQMVKWQGQIWPGMPMEWEVQEDKPDSGGNTGGQQSSWTSKVRFEMPHLGGVSATIHLLGNRVHVQVDTETEDAAMTVRAFGGLLADALEAAGAPLDSLSVKQHGST